MNDKRFEKTVDAIRKAPAIQRPKMVDGLRKSEGDGLKPAQLVKLERIREVALA